MGIRCDPSTSFSSAANFPHGASFSDSSLPDAFLSLDVTLSCSISFCTHCPVTPASSSLLGLSSFVLSLKAFQRGGSGVNRHLSHDKLPYLGFAQIWLGLCICSSYIYSDQKILSAFTQALLYYYCPCLNVVGSKLVQGKTQPCSFPQAYHLLPRQNP